MDEPRAKMMPGLERAYRMVEALVLADLRETTRRALAGAFGASPEFRLVEAMARAADASFHRASWPHFRRASGCNAIETWVVKRKRGLRKARRQTRTNRKGRQQIPSDASHKA